MCRLKALAALAQCAHLNDQARRCQQSVVVSSPGGPTFRGSKQRCLAIHLIIKVFDSLCLALKVKIIGLSTDGAPSMTGCNFGFMTQLANVVVGGKLYHTDLLVQLVKPTS